jgi:protein-tyrosine-phosphatase
MGGIMLEHLADDRGLAIDVVTAGTHSVDGMPMSLRTRQALLGIDGLTGVGASGHRSRQLREADVESVDLVVAMESAHVRYIRRNHPRASERTATIRRLATDLQPGPPSLARRVARLGLGRLPIDEGEDVLDPAGGDDGTYRACAEELWVLCRALADRL